MPKKKIFFWMNEDIRIKRIIKKYLNKNYTNAFPKNL